MVALLLFSPIPSLAEDTETTQSEASSTEDTTVQETSDTASDSQADTKASNASQKVKGEKDKDAAEADLEDTATMSTLEGGEEETVMEPAQVSLFPEPDLFTGSMTYPIPIRVPPGRTGLAPELALVYNTYAKNGPIGVGWSLNIPSIRCSTKWGMPYDGDYVVDNGGSVSELVSRSDDWGPDYYGAKIEGDFTKYYLDPNTKEWTVTSREGTKYYFGPNLDFRQVHPSDSSKIFRWCLQRIEDSNGNYIDFTYFKDQEQIYIDEIEYTGPYPSNLIKFHYDDTRPDVIFNHSSQYQIKTAKRLDEIEIRAKDNVLVRKYTLNYPQTLGTSNRSRLVSCQEIGSDNSSTLPAHTVLDWQEGGNGSFTQTSASIPGYYLAYQSFLTDITGDGRADLVYRCKDGIVTFFRIYRSNGDGTFTLISGDILEQGTVFGDVNGDGLGDYIEGTGNNKRLFLGNGDGTFTQTSASIPGYYLAWQSFLTDITGDGRADLVYRCKDDIVTFFRIYRSNGDGTFTLISGDILDQSAIFGDINGDGLGDYIDNPFQPTLFLGNGDGTFTQTSASIPVDPSARQYLLTDITGDGRADLVHRFKVDIVPLFNIYRSNGDGTFTLISGDILDQSAIFGDVNGDGLGDYIDNPFQPTLFLGNGDGIPDVITSLETSRGAQINLTYTPSTTYNNQILPFALPTISSMTVDDGLGNLSPTSYDYDEGLFDGDTREFRGFKYITKTRPDDTIEEYEFHQDEFKKGRIKQRDLWSPNKASHLQQETKTWDTYSTDPSSWAFVKLTEKKTDYYDNNIPSVYNQENYTYYDDSHGSLYTLTTSGTDAEEVTTKYIYSNYDDWAWRTTREDVKNSSSVLLRRTYYRYLSGTGNLYEKEFYLNTGTNPVFSYDYDTYGNLWKEHDAKGNPPTVYQYDSATNTYPVQITNPAGHIVEKDWDYRFGKESWVEDANDQRTDYTYDPFGRVEKVEFPDGGQQDIVYEDDEMPRNVKTTVKENDDSTIDKYDYFDGLNRLVQSITLGEGNNKIVIKKFYDEMGREKKVVGPFFSTSFGYPQTTPSDSPWTQTHYDDQGRVDYIQSANGDYGTITTNYNYNGFSVTITDPDEKQKTEKRDYLGRIIEVIEHADDGDYHTYYTYNGAGDLLTVTDNEDNETTITYDTMGRKTSMDDPNMGYWIYTYDLNSNLDTQTDEKGTIIDFDYDAINRITSKEYTVVDPDTDVPPNVTYAYDNASIYNGIGRLYSVTNGNVTNTYNDYDEMGRVKSVTKTISGMSAKTTSYEYDLSGKVTKITYPDGYYVDQTFYDGTGLLYQVIGSDGELYAECSLYEPTGKMGRIKHDNGVWTDYSYDPKSTRLEEIITYKGVNIISNYTYVYSRAGDIEIKTDVERGITHNYTYDNLHRLTGETLTGNVPAGTGAPKLLEFEYTDNDHPHAVTEITMNGQVYNYNYDDNGNMTNGPDFTDITNVATRAIKFNADNMVTNIQHSVNGTVNILYDGDGVRAKKTKGTNATYYIDQTYEIINNKATKYIFAGNLRVAKVDSTSLYYYHKDHLGSSTVVTNASGNNIEQSEYAPFGEQRWQVGTSVSNYKFTDQELDNSTGLYNYDARLYDPIIGRFISPDNIVPNWYNPQYLNRYTYCRNNPLSYVDPTGHFEETNESLIDLAGLLIAAELDAESTVTDRFGNPVVSGDNTIVRSDVYGIYPTSIQLTEYGKTIILDWISFGSDVITLFTPASPVGIAFYFVGNVATIASVLRTADAYHKGLITEDQMIATYILAAVSISPRFGIAGSGIQLLIDYDSSKAIYETVTHISSPWVYDGIPVSGLEMLNSSDPLNYFFNENY